MVRDSSLEDDFCVQKFLKRYFQVRCQSSVLLLVTLQTALAQYRFDNLEYFLMQEQAYEDAGLLSYEYQTLESSGDYTPGSVSKDIAVHLNP